VIARSERLRRNAAIATATGRELCNALYCSLSFFF